MQLSELKIVVTGGASGLGRCFVEQLAAAGASVAFCDLNAEAVSQVEQALSHAPGVVRGFVADVSSESDVISLIDQAWEAFGSLNGLINNAGIFRDGLLVRSDHKTGEISKLSLDHWNQVLAVDLTGPFLATRELVARVLEHKTGPAVVVNISSISRHGNRGQSNYSAAKAGLVADTRVWATELARYGIRVGAIAPGFVRTPILEGMRPAVLDQIIAAVPLGRVGEPEEIWQAVRFVIECDYFTGRCIDLDGGLRV